jgi:predicted aconitase with swiveling domain
VNELNVRILAPGAAIGPAAVLDDPLSLWGGLDPATGLLTDPHHPQHGMSLAGRVVVMPGGRGSSSSSSVLAEAVRAGVAPAAFVLFEPDLILAIGAMVAEELYDVRVPVVVVARQDLDGLRDGAALEITAGGVLRWEAL